MAGKFKTYEATIELFWDASRIIKRTIKAKRIENAKALIEKKTIKEFNTDMVIIRNIKEII